MRLWKTVAAENSTGVLPFMKDWFADFLASEDYQSAIDLLKRCHTSNDPEILIAADPQWRQTEFFPLPSGIYLTQAGFVQCSQWLSDDYPYESSSTSSIERDEVLEKLRRWNSVGHLDEIHARLDILTITALRRDSIAPRSRNVYR